VSDLSAIGAAPADRGWERRVRFEDEERADRSEQSIPVDCCARPRG